MAAGKGTRMGTDLPKVLTPTLGRPMVEWVIEACREAGISRIVLIVGHGAELVRAAYAGQSDIEFVVQSPQLGTGHAVDQARPILIGLDASTPVVVLGGDGPLIRSSTIRTLIHEHKAQSAAATLATSVIADPVGYGRIVRGNSGEFIRIVEHKDANATEQLIAEVNPSYYCFRNEDLLRDLSHVGNKNASGEFYLVDVLTILRTNGRPVHVVCAVPPEDVLSINTPAQLIEVESILRQREAASTARSHA